MSGFRDHFIDKYFGYRRAYVDHFARNMPQRARLALRSEVARLSFTLFGSLLCAAIFALLVVASFARAGTLLAALPLTFVAVTGCSLMFALLAARGILQALGDRARVEAEMGNFSDSQRAPDR